MAFQLLQAYSAGCVTHLLRANFEEGPWLQRLDDTWLAIVQDIVGDPLPQDRRKQLFLRLADGGLGLTSAMETASLAFLASWAFRFARGRCHRRDCVMGYVLSAMQYCR